MQDLRNPFLTERQRSQDADRRCDQRDSTTACLALGTCGRSLRIGVAHRSTNTVWMFNSVDWPNMAPVGTCTNTNATNKMVLISRT